MKKYTYLYLFSFFALMMACEEEAITIPRLEIEATVNEVSSFGAKDGRIEVEVNGGVPPYLYSWSHGETSATVSGLAAGSYTLRIVDSESSVVEETFTLLQPNAVPLDLSFQVNDASLFGGNDGSVSVSVAGGTAPYSFLWSDGSTTPELNNLSSDLYTLTVTDASDPAIVTIDSVFVNQPTFVCGRDSITDVDGNKYATIQLGDQCWTASNLRTLHHPKNAMMRVEGVLCNGLNCTNDLGAHYTWNAATLGETEQPIQGVCPCEWHLPSAAEWTALNTFLSQNGNGGEGQNVPNKLRGADSSSGFDALYAGNWGYPLFDGELAAFWTSTASGETQATYRLINRFPLLGQGNVNRDVGLSVRCVKD